VLLYNQHYTPITKIKAFMGKAYWCDKCLKAFTPPEGIANARVSKDVQSVVS
jgi:hypothetical protein